MKNFRFSNLEFCSVIPAYRTVCLPQAGQALKGIISRELYCQGRSDTLHTFNISNLSSLNAVSMLCTHYSVLTTKYSITSYFLINGLLSLFKPIVCASFSVSNKILDSIPAPQLLARLLKYISAEAPS
jgi:hypothetical protein